MGWGLSVYFLFCELCERDKLDIGKVLRWQREEGNRITPTMGGQERMIKNKIRCGASVVISALPLPCYHHFGLFMSTFPFIPLLSESQLSLWV